MSKKSFIVKPSHFGNCVRLAGNATAGGFLYRIYCRSNKSTFKDRNGVKGWAVLTREEWMIDLGFTRHQYDRALKRLKENNILIWKNRHRGHPVGGPPIWVKLSDEIVQKIQDTELQKTDSPSRGIKTQVGEESRKKRTPIYNCENKINVNTKQCISSDEESPEDNSAKDNNKKNLREDKNTNNIKDDNVIYIDKDLKMKKGGGKGIDVIRSKRKSNIEQTIKDLKNKKPRTQIKGATGFYFLWQELHSEYFSDIEVHDWSGKEKGFANSIMKKINNIPKASLPNIIHAVFENWEEYAEFACAQRGQDRLPYSPNIGFIAGGFQDLMIWYRQRDEDVYTSAQPEDPRKGFMGKRRKIKSTGSKGFTRRDERTV